MTAGPICPGVTEYLYQAAMPAPAGIAGTATVPSGFSPMYSNFECTLIAGMETETGSERLIDGPRRAAPVTPAAAAAGWGACCWDNMATPMATMPPTSDKTPATPAKRARLFPGGGSGGGE